MRLAAPRQRRLRGGRRGARRTFFRAAFGLDLRFLSSSLIPATSDASLHARSAAAHEQLVELRERAPGATSAGRGCTGRSARSPPSRAAGRSSPATVSLRLARTAAWQAMVASSSLRRSVSTRLAPYSRSSRSTSDARRRASASASSAGTARTMSEVGEAAAMSKPIVRSTAACSSTVATSSGLGGERHRHQQRLHRDLAPVERVLQLLVHDALVRGVHVHDHQSVPVLGEHVDAGELRQRESERRLFRRPAGAAAARRAAGTGSRRTPIGSAAPSAIAAWRIGCAAIAAQAPRPSLRTRPSPRRPPRPASALFSAWKMNW